MTDNSYLVLARKYRPSNFDELVGQEVLVTTLVNAIKNNRLHHAYILTGIRGVGKTTTARIIAKTINCLELNSSSIANACGVCDNCKLIAASKHQDVIEIDAASRTGVDDIREIIDSIAYSPVIAKYKIYIIDEVHMLSNNAFNALLKTLEEPPAHVKFIFATTEIKKVPVTILSRCQRFDLRRLDESEIVIHLKNILEKENILADEIALNLIAKFSEGSVRDSLSLLDQAISINNQEKITSDLVEKMLGLNDRSKVIELMSAILSGDFASSLNHFGNFYTFSSDVLQLIHDLMEITHKITSCKLIKDYHLNGYSNFQQTKIIELSQKTSLNSLTRIWQMFQKACVEISFANSTKMSFEMILARICHLSALPDLKKVLLDLHSSKNNFVQNENVDHNNSILDQKSVDQKFHEVNDEIVNEILHSFEGSKIIN
jgi:DNA polymerase-3 subunit gamma/tau